MASLALISDKDEPLADLFFYGSLRHLPLLGVVLGREPRTLETVSADLPDHAVFWVRDQPFPIIHPQAGATTPGLMVRGLSSEDIVRLRYYEGGFDYRLRPMHLRLESGQSAVADVFFPAPDLWPLGAPWSLGDWVADWADISEQAAREVMAWYGRKSPEQIARAFPGIRRRAAAHVAARQRARDRERDLSSSVIVHAQRYPYANFFAVQEVDLQVRQYDGAMGPVVNRAALLVGEAAVVLPYDPVRDTVLLIEQFRAPLLIAGDPTPWVWEPVAGLLEPGESAETAARRETLEEAGLTIAHLEPAGQVYSSTGSSTEFLHLFIGLADLGGDIPTVGGADEGEDIRSRVMGFDALMQGVDERRYFDMPLVTTALWLARHRGRLRQAHGAQA